VSETVAALSELLASTDEVIDPPRSYLVGQLASELVASGTEPQLSEAIVAIKDSQQNVGPEDASPYRESVLAMLSGLLQGVLADRQSAGRPGSELTVREQVLNLLAIEPQNPTTLATEIGCAPATVSRALGRLREVGLVDSEASSEPGDGRRVTYQLTTKGEKHLDDRFFGQLADDEQGLSEGDQDDQEDREYDYSRLLAPLTGVVAELNTHAPAIAATLYPGLDVLKDQVDDPGLRAAAVGELGAHYGGNPDVASAEQLGH
jgi:DNA-binding MarR family transcriptional regulator